MNADLVCEGGGVKGIALVGAICRLEKEGYTFQKLAGTSAGAIVAALIAVGYKGREIMEIFLNLNLKIFKDKNKTASIPLIGPATSLIKNKGLHSGDTIEKFLDEKLRAKGKTKFKDISINGVSPLKITATDITNRELLILPDDLVKYNINPMEFEIAKAVRMSISIPFYFNPVIINNEKNSNFIVDGGLLSNFPVWLFDIEGIPRWPTFGLKLIGDKDMKIIQANKSNIINYMFSIINTALSKNEEVYLLNKDAVRTIKIRTFNFETTDFNISKNDMFKLFNSGYDAANEFLKEWNFNIYLNKYRNI
jgi:NTE family protein